MLPCAALLHCLPRHPLNPPTLQLEVEFETLAELEQFWAAIPPKLHKPWSQRMQARNRRRRRRQPLQQQQPQPALGWSSVAPARRGLAWHERRPPPVPPIFSPGPAGGARRCRAARLTLPPSLPHLPQHLVVHGSPTWELYRTVPAFGPQSPGASVAASRARAPPALVVASDDDVGKYGGPPAPPSTAQTTSSGLSVVSGADEAAQVLDWKGDPMTINPGDKMPFRSF
jgi:hypothetical protein